MLEAWVRLPHQRAKPCPRSTRVRVTRSADRVDLHPAFDRGRDDRSTRGLDAAIQALARSVDGRAGVTSSWSNPEHAWAGTRAKRFPSRRVQGPDRDGRSATRRDGRLASEAGLDRLADIAIEQYTAPSARRPAAHPLSVRDLLRAAVLESDGTASDKLLQLVSPEEVTAYVRARVDSMSPTTERRSPRTRRAYGTGPRLGRRIPLRTLMFGKSLSASSRDLSWSG